MTSFQRMIAIPQEEYLALSTMQNVREPLAQHFYNLEKRYKDEENEKDPYRRMLLQSNTLDQLKQVKDQMRDSLVVATPKPYQSRAKALYQSLETFIKFNEKGEIYSDTGDLVPGSRLEDLIQHAVRDRRRNIMPKGWSEFLRILRDHNVPKFMLNRNTLDEMEEIVSPIRVIKQEAQTPTQRTPFKERVRKRDLTRIQPSRTKKPETKDFKKVDFLKRF